MPSVSKKQHKFFEAVTHSPGFAEKAGVPQSVGKDFAKADDKAGITKTHNGRPIGSPKSKEEHMARRTKHVTQAAAGKEFGTSQSTISRKVMRNGFTQGKL